MALASLCSMSLESCLSCCGRCGASSSFDRVLFRLFEDSELFLYTTTGVSGMGSPSPSIEVCSGPSRSLLSRIGLSDDLLNERLCLWGVAPPSSCGRSRCDRSWDVFSRNSPSRLVVTALFSSRSISRLRVPLGVVSRTRKGGLSETCNDRPVKSASTSHTGAPSRNVF